ncbi:MAG: hypothetical protein CRN43_00800 [Candidatus Nephrothrix sp. EaCA]|nr:MAG: hypothetical protein CRN43_00800 [Candidatus Nephrothrix sp. EaCA]
MVKINTAYCPENLFNEALTAEEMVAFNRLQEVWGDDEAYETLFRHHEALNANVCRKQSEKI